MPKYSWDIKDILFEEDVKAIYNLAKSQEQRVFVSELWITAGRPEEILKLKPEDFVISPDELHITLKTLKLRKGGAFDTDTRTLKFNRPRGENLNIYIETIIDWVLKAKPQADIIPYTSRWGELLINRLGEQTIGKKICPYHFRHSVLSWLAKNGASVSELMHFKGARSIQSVQCYLHAVPYLVKLETMDRRRIRTDPLNPDKVPQEEVKPEPVPEAKVEETKVE